MTHLSKYTKVIIAILLCFIVFDLGFSYYQYYNLEIDGDFAPAIIPDYTTAPVLDFPFGFSDSSLPVYPNPNRYFAYLLFYKFFNWGPFFFQNFTSAINSIYQSCALAKILMHLILLFGMAFIIYGSKTFNSSIKRLNFIIILAVLESLFQTFTYSYEIGLIGDSISYSIFYGLPTGFLLLTLLPFFIIYFHNKSISESWILKCIWILVALMTCFSGPLNPAVILISITVFIMLKTINPQYFSRSITSNFWQKNAPLILIFFSVYSSVLNSINSLKQDLENTSYFQKIIFSFTGLYKTFFDELGPQILFFLIVLAIILCIFLRKKIAARHKLLLAFTIIVIITYTLLIPLGGIRDCRMFYLRFDTFLPMTALLYICLVSFYFNVFQIISNKLKGIYIIALIVVLSKFYIPDATINYANKGQRIGMQILASSKADSLILPKANCIFTWGPIDNFELSTYNAELLHRWHVTSKTILFKNK
jgi:hypothetical protein